jgi:ATP-binding cassette subfamily B (MDR/TAP) protein 1
MIPLLAVLLGAIFNEFTKYASHSLSNAELIERVSHYCIYLSALGTATWVLHTLQFALWVASGELQLKVARERLFDALLRADIKWFETAKDSVGGLLPRLQ